MWNLKARTQESHWGFQTLAESQLVDTFVANQPSYLSVVQTPYVRQPPPLRRSEKTATEATTQRHGREAWSTPVPWQAWQEFEQGELASRAKRAEQQHACVSAEVGPARSWLKLVAEVRLEQQELFSAPWTNLRGSFESP